MLSQRSPERLSLLVWSLLGLFSLFASIASAQEIILHLEGGDKVSGFMLSETTNNVVLSNSWIPEISIPVSQIVLRLTNMPPVAVADSSSSASTLPALNGRVEPKPGGPVAPLKSNGWMGEAQTGLDLLFGSKDRQIFHGRFKLAYQQPYHSDPKKFFRNMFDYSAEYGTTEGETSSDRMNASDKAALDFAKSWYVYNLAGGGYDHILKIDAQYEAGPGIGYHLFTLNNFVMNVEFGLNYQAQFRSDNSEIRDVYYRFAEELVWKVAGRLSLSEKLEYFPRLNWSGERLRFESTLTYGLWRNLYLNLTLLDLYDTQSADQVNHNDLQIRSAIGVKF